MSDSQVNLAVGSIAFAPSSPSIVYAGMGDSQAGYLGWGHLAAVIDCHDREIVGCEFAKEAERALEPACLKGFGTLSQSSRRQ